MGYQALIRKNLDFAFNQIKDLATVASFYKKQSAGFDFNAQEASVVVNSPIEIKIVDLETIGNNKETDHKTKQLLVKKHDVGDLSSYDYLKINNINWKLGQVLTDTGYVIMFTVVRT